MSRASSLYRPDMGRVLTFLKYKTPPYEEEDTLEEETVEEVHLEEEKVEPLLLAISVPGCSNKSVTGSTRSAAGTVRASMFARRALSALAAANA